MKKLGDAISKMDMAGHMGCGESAAADGSSPCTPSSSVELINLTVCEGGACPPPIIPPPHTQIRDVVSLGETVDVARSMGIPDWYAAYWHKSMSASGWVTARGRKITKRSWRALLMKWWANSSETEKARVLAEYNAEQKSAAEEKDDPEPKIEITAHHWYECQRTCANFKKGKCIWGARHPAVLYKRNNGFTDRCLHFEPLPLEWQWAWVLDPKFWEPHVRIDPWGRPCNCAGFKATEKGQSVKAYFDAHPDELEEARWRNDHNEPTEEECAAVRAWLAWVARAKARGKKAKGGVAM